MPGEFWRYADEIVFANGDDLDRVGVLEVGGVRVRIGREQLFRCF